MSNNATSNETDLDWLARNVHVWPTNTPKAILPGDATFKLGAVFYGDCVAFSGELGPEYRRVNKADWLTRRAELQSVTEQFKPSIEEDNRLAQEFKPFASIEDNQEREMNQDNEWFERGELPPVGFECEMKRIDGRWCKAVTVGKDSGGRMVCELNDNGVFYASTSSAESFRPIRTERDVLISVIIDEMNRYDTDAKLADAILEAGFRLGVK